MQLLSLTAVFLAAVLSNNAFALTPAADPTGHGPIQPVSGCTSTFTRNPTFNIRPTSTEYKSTVTVTASVDCGECCEVAVTTRALGPGPVVHHTTTTTVDASTATKEVCAEKTAKVYKA